MLDVGCWIEVSRCVGVLRGVRFIEPSDEFEAKVEAGY